MQPLKDKDAVTKMLTPQLELPASQQTREGPLTAACKDLFKDKLTSLFG